MTFDVDFKHFGQNIQSFKFLREKSDLPLTIEKSPLKIFLHIKFLFVN